MTATQQNTGAAGAAAPSRVLRFYPLATHRMRRTDYWPTHHRGALWMTVCRSARQPRYGDCWIFTDAKTGATQHASVEGMTATHWLLLLGRTDDLWKVTRLSRARWQPTWLVRYVCLCTVASAYYDALAIGDRARAERILRARYGKGRMPKPLPATVAIPELVKLANPGDA
jgi:hypothetical protein